MSREVSEDQAAGTGDSPLDFDAVEVAFLLFTLLLAGIHLYLGLFDPMASADRSVQFLLIGAAFLAGFVARITPYWHPTLYLLGAAFAVILGVLWVLGGTDQFTLGIATGAVASAFIVVALYLFVRDESRSVRR
ncbi:MAG: hypothetical protein RI560_05040 [Natronomonas sp.]|jgi:hypothetical protein|uniref:DUF7475 family protein n=1 Tax=Natronomonas sp. TaxID=2184060 RepID=UPI00287008DF|nr:hypothetical protein [Natronomonas sp.]MDR9381025.1 hypothetical protein [Natronomonas sp.]MDR9431441.1 hypothetical protein [Natronomonas sp.]